MTVSCNLGISGGKTNVLWIRFDEEDHYKPAPDFCLPVARAGNLCLSDLRGDCNVILLFSHGTKCRSCLDLMEGFVKRREQYRDEGARVLVICPEEEDAIVKSITSHPFLEEPPLTLLSDPEGCVRPDYTGLMDDSLTNQKDALLYVLDHFGAPYSALAAAELDDPAIHHDAINWLEYIGTRCPE
jgi:peroxiredoxin